MTAPSFFFQKVGPLHIEIKTNTSYEIHLYVEKERPCLKL